MAQDQTTAELVDARWRDLAIDLADALREWQVWYRSMSHQNLPLKNTMEVLGKMKDVAP